MQSLLITLVLVVGIVWLVFWVADRMGAPEPITMIVKVVAGLIAIFFLIQQLQILT